MSDVTFQKAVCQLHGIKESRYKRFVLTRSLFRRTRIVRPIVSFFYPNFLFNEKRLVDRVANAQNLREVQEEVDFYQHKFVVNFIMKDAFRFRLSGMRLMSMANKAFRAAAAQSTDQTGNSPQNPLRS